jgi:hypothetical protein
MKTTLKRGDEVRSLNNKTMRYRVLSIGPKRARLSALGIGYFTCYCPTRMLRRVRLAMCQDWPRCSCVLRGTKLDCERV